MSSHPHERAGAPFVAALSTCTDHLTVDETIEVVRSRAGEAELNDLLRHAVNRLVRAEGWIVEREVSDRSHGLSRIDLALTETGSGMRFAWVEAKIKYATDAVESPEVFVHGGNSIEKDARTLLASPTPTPKFLLTWVPHVTHSAFRLRYGGGHDQGEDGWRARLDVERCRDACGALLAQFGETRRVEVKSGVGDFGSISLDAWWTSLQDTGAVAARGT